MLAHLSEYHRPKTVGTALHLLARQSPRSAPLAGGTWLVAERDPTIEAVVDLSALNLAFVEQRGRRLRLGAMTTLQTLIADQRASTLVHALLAEAARRSAPRAIRNVATLGGALVAGGATSEVTLALLVLNAQVVIRAPSRRVVSLDAFLAKRAEYLPSTGLIVEVVVPLPSADTGVALAEVSRTPRDRPIVNAAAAVTRTGDVCRAARLALGGVAPDPIRLPAIEANAFRK
jgi:carbon-monoxide dehydrogenase medium subunit